MLTAPFFSAGVFPVRVKVFTGLVLGFCLFPVIPVEISAVNMNMGFLDVIILVVKESLVGITMGLAGQIIFAGIQMSGQIISLKMALSFASIVDPMTRDQGGVVNQVLALLGLLVFLHVGGDAMYLKAMMWSFEVVPVGTIQAELATPLFIEMTTYLFLIGFQLAAPFIVILFLIDMSFAIFARIMPQANIFFISLPVKVGVGLLVFVAVIPFLPFAFEIMFDRLAHYISLLLEAVSGN